MPTVAHVWSLAVVITSRGCWICLKTLQVQFHSSAHVWQWRLIQPLLSSWNWLKELRKKLRGNHHLSSVMCANMILHCDEKLGGGFSPPPAPPLPMPLHWIPFWFQREYITQYGSTVYIGIAMVYPHWKPYIRFFITFTFGLLRNGLLLTWVCNYTQKLTVIIKWYNLIDDKGVKLTKVYFVNSSSSASSSSALTGATH